MSPGVRKTFLLILGALSMTACSLAPDYTRPDVHLAAHYYEGTVDGETIANLKWWEVLHDPNLQGLLELALRENKELQIAVARINGSRALVGVARAEQFPQLELNGTAQRIDSGDEILSLSTSPRNEFGIFSLLSFELDFWGKLQNATAAQRAELLASEYGHRAVVVSLISRVATLYLNILGLDNRLEIATRTYKNRAGATKIIKARLEKGIVPELDLNQAQVEEYEAIVTKVALERALRNSENALNVLLGRASLPIDRSKLREQNFNLPIPGGFPALLLQRRPDILAAEAEVKAAVARVGVARAEQLPSFSLLGSIGLQSRKAEDLFQGSALSWSIGGDLLGPLIDWGRSSSRVDFARAQLDASYRQYEQTVLQSVQEVEDALVGVRTYREERTERSRQVVAGRNAAKLSRARYYDGVTSYLEVLDNERSLFNTELAESESLERYYSSIVLLYKALGGGWEA